MAHRAMMGRGRRWAARSLLIGFALVGPAVAPVGAQATTPATQSPERTTLDGVYTSDQAAAGREVYIASCAGCHALDWYTGDVMRAWRGAALDGLFDLIRTTMPQDNPGSLPTRDYAAVLAYILELNGLPAGPEPLPTGRARLAAIRLTFDEETR